MSTPSPPRTILWDSRLKMHLRVLPLVGRTHRLVTLRPAVDAGFSTNYYHGTWHVLSDYRGCQLLARLLWGLAFQKHPGTIVLVHGSHLLPTPFEGNPSDPFLFTLPETPLTPDAVRQLKRQLRRLPPPTCTIRWQTHGLDLAEAALAREEKDPDTDRLRWKASDRIWAQEHITRTCGVICYAAPAIILRRTALVLASMRVRQGKYHSEMDYRYIAEHRPSGWFPDGEVQIFNDYHDRVRAATVARRELGIPPSQVIPPDGTLELTVSRRREALVHHHHREIRRRKRRRSG